MPSTNAREIQLHWIKTESGKEECFFVYGQLVASVESNGFLKYYKYENIEDEVQRLMDKWLTKKN